MIDVSLVRQDIENYSYLEMLFEGRANQLKPEYPGDISFHFNDSSIKKNFKVRFNFVSSVLYADEILWSNLSYPYFKDVNKKNGIFIVHDSTYMIRIKDFFPDHSHYIYFDENFNWHITAKELKVIFD